MRNNEDEMNVQEQEKLKDKKKKNIWRTISIVLFVLLVILLAFLLGRCSCDNTIDPPTPTINQDAPDVDPNAGEYVKPETEPGVAGGVAVPGWGKLTIPANTQDDIVVDFFNPIENEGKYYLTFELRIPSDNDLGYEVLYTSGLIEPGLHIQSISLTRGLETGEYDAIIHVQPYRMDTKAKTNNADLKTKLIVK